MLESVVVSEAGEGSNERSARPNFLFLTNFDAFDEEKARVEVLGMGSDAVEEEPA